MPATGGTCVAPNTAVTRTILAAAVLVGALSVVHVDPPAETRVTLVATDYAFSPTEIHAVAGGSLAITLDNRGAHTHGLRLVLSYGEVPFPQNVPPGQKVTEVFNDLGSSGRFRFYCPVEDDDARGMHGTLIIEAAKTK